MDSPRARRLIGRAAFAAACVGTVLGPVHALARFATADGSGDLSSPVVRAWAGPAARALRPLLDWGSADTVYLTYGKLWLPVLAVTTLCAFAVRGTRTPAGLERLAWPVALTGYTLATVAVLGDFWTPWTDSSFVFVELPAMLIGLVGSLLLGVALLRRGFRPRATGWLLATWVVTLFAISAVVAQGAALVPVLWAWALAGRHLATRPEDAQPPRSTSAWTTPRSAVSSD